MMYGMSSTMYGLSFMMYGISSAMYGFDKNYPQAGRGICIRMAAIDDVRF